MAKLISVRPTKIELVRLKRRLSLATRVQKIVKDRLSILTIEFLQSARETVKAKENLVELYSKAYQALSVAAGYHGLIALEKELAASQKETTVSSGFLNIAGVKMISLEVNETEEAIRGYDYIDTSPLVDDAARLFEESLKASVDLAEKQTCMNLLGAEINRAKRITNALEYLIIPSLQFTIKFLNMKFEERDREEKSRLKRVKVLLERR